MAYDLQEQEQLAELKAWWGRYGNLASWAISLVIFALAGWQLWNWHLRREAAAAAGTYGEFSAALAAKNLARERLLAGSLIEAHPSTAFAALAALQMARANLDANDAASARAQLQWVIDKSGEPELVALARVRLAGVLLDAKEFDAALKVLDASVPAPYAGEVADRRADILLAQGRTEDARKDWQTALDKLPAGSPLRGLVQSKLDALAS